LNLHYYKAFIVGALLVGAVSCNSSSEIGSDFLEGGSLSLSYIDTLSLRVSTVILDSISTSNNGRLLIGYADDPQIGKLTASPCFQLETSNVQKLDEEFTYSYLALHLEYDDYSFYDTTQWMKLKVYEIDEEIELEDDGKLYNNKTFKKKLLDGQLNSLGEIAIAPTPKRSDTLEITINDSFGLNLFQLLKEGDTKVTSKTDFQDFLKGLVIEPDTVVSSCFVGFKPTATLRLHYIDNGTPKRKRYLDFPVGSSIYYNQIKSNRSSTELKELVTREKSLSSNKTNNVAYLHNGIGLGIRVEIPHLRSILQFDKNLIVSQASIKIVPIGNTYSDNMQLPSSHAMYAVDKFNDVYQAYQNSLLLLEDDLLKRDTHYEADVTEFVKTQLGTDLTNQNALYFLPASPGTRIDRIYTGDGNNKFGMELRIYYSQVN
jgi:Domain of unknown function (DUF4270)